MLYQQTPDAPNPNGAWFYFIYQAHWSALTILGSSESNFATALCQNDHATWRNLYAQRMHSFERAGDAMRLLGLPNAWFSYSNARSFPVALIDSYALRQRQHDQSIFLPQNRRDPEPAFYTKHFYAFEQHLSVLLLVNALCDLTQEHTLPRIISQKHAWSQTPQAVENPAHPAKHLESQLLHCFVHFFTPLVFLQHTQKLPPDVTLPQYVQYMQEHHQSYPTSFAPAQKSHLERTQKLLQQMRPSNLSNTSLLEHCEYFFRCLQNNTLPIAEKLTFLSENYNSQAFPFTSTDQFDPLFLPRKDEQKPSWLLEPPALWSAFESMHLHAALSAPQEQSPQRMRMRL